MHVPRRLVGLGAVVRRRVGHAFAPGLEAAREQAHQDEHLVVDAPEAGLEEVHQRQPQQPEFDAIDSHERLLAYPLVLGT